jgi:hypothetical protein
LDDQDAPEDAGEMQFLEPQIVGVETGDAAQRREQDEKDD